MSKTAFVIIREEQYEDASTIMGIYSTEEKAKRAIAILNAENQFDTVKYSYEEYDLDKITIFL